MQRFRVGDWVEVRSKAEILKTLDSNGQLDGMPFMPEMFAFCGQKHQVFKRAHKTCDTVFPIRGRRLDRVVHLATRCNGSAHGGCQAECLIFWKEAWLKPLDRVSVDVWGDAAKRPPDVFASSESADCTEQDIWNYAALPASNGESKYVCQATQLPYATTDLSWWDVRQYVEDYRSGNVGGWRILSAFIYSGYYMLSNAGIGIGPAMRWLYDTFHPLWRGTRWPRRRGSLPPNGPTPAVAFNLQPGELVRIRTHDEILGTLTTDNKNRGMYWDAEMVPYCGRTVRVLKRVTRILDEKTGLMREMKTPCIMLDSVVCESRYSHCRLFCPRSIHSYWREIWLERVPQRTVTPDKP
jgi:hypothetical protein